MQFAQIIQSIRETSLNHKLVETKFEVFKQRWGLQLQASHSSYIMTDLD